MRPRLSRSLCVVLTSPLVLNAFLLNHLRSLADDWTVTVCVNTEEYPVSSLLDPRVELLHLPIARNINLYRDTLALVWLIRLFLRRRFVAVHSVTPKGGLLAMLAARLASIPHRTHTFTGQIWANRGGLARLLLKSMDRVTALCATAVHADSCSQARFLEREGVCANGSVQVFGAGSISGVDLARFSCLAGRRETMRSTLEIPADATVFVFLGRHNVEKGVLVLAEAFAQLRDDHPEAWMLFVGPDEGGLAARLLSVCGDRGRWLGLTDKPEACLDAADVLCLPSYREGFGTVVIEAAAMGLPAIVSDIYGLTDAVVDQETGLLCPVGDARALAAAMRRFMDRDLRLRFGEAARQRAHESFSAESSTASWRGYYARILTPITLASGR